VDSRTDPGGGTQRGAAAPLRRGDAVVRPAAPRTASVHALLAHLRARGVSWVPEPLAAPPGAAGAPLAAAPPGAAGAPLAAVSWVEGEVPAYPMPAYVWAPAVLDRAGAMLRELHDATAGFDRAGRVWALPPREPAEVICHNDFAPYNLAFRAGLPAGAIDFEAASPGPRAWDLAYLAYRLVPLARPDNPDLPPRRDPEARLARLCAAYGDIDPAAVRALVPPRLRELAAAAPPAHARLYRADATHVEPSVVQAEPE
jgi:Ser/Thr protein kinase RdoA (MazF antagonist)